MGLTKPFTINNQLLMWEQINWGDRPIPASPPKLNGVHSITGRPSSTKSGEPYWEFDWELSYQSGIKLTNIVARDTQDQVAGSSEPVCEAIDFTDLKLALDNTPVGSLVDYDIAKGFSHPDSFFELDSNGTRYTVCPGDPLFQYGLCLQLVNDINRIRVILRIAIAFRGAANDFDPGRVAVALEIFPQIGWKWERTAPSERRVRQFRGSVRATVNNYMKYGTHAGHMPMQNIASFLADNNTSLDNRAKLANDTSIGTRANLAAIQGAPFGWAMVFDYNRLNLMTEQEYPAVYGPKDGTLYSFGRYRTYYWPSGTKSDGGIVRKGGFLIEKLARQGYYDNIHIHANMGNDKRSNLQIHAPFCGHSCVHVHWRWSHVSSNGALDNRGWQFKGWWARGTRSQAHMTVGASLIPPNQKLTVALCAPSRMRHSDAQILPPAGGGALNVLRKMIWYCADIFHVRDVPLNAGEQQVIMEYGLAWAYRYSTPMESNSVLMLLLGVKQEIPPIEFLLFPTQQQLADFFEEDVYPLFRYYDANGIVVNQVPEGQWADVQSGGTSVKLEEL